MKPLRQCALVLGLALLIFGEVACAFQLEAGRSVVSASRKSSHLRGQKLNAVLTEGDSPGLENPFDVIQSAVVQDPITGKTGPALDSPKKPAQQVAFPFFGRGGDSGKGKDKKKTLVVVMPQLGDFDSAEYAELLASVLDDLRAADIDLRVIGLGDAAAARRFCAFTGLPPAALRADPAGALHRRLGLHGGPGWDVPAFVPAAALRWFAAYVGAPEDPDPRGVARAWLNYMAMCAGIAAPDTLPEILRGYLGDRAAPERLRPDAVVRVGEVIEIRGTTDVRLGPLRYRQPWAGEAGYQRPVELATVRLRALVEVLSRFGEYVPDQKHLHLRGATFLFDAAGGLLHGRRDTGVLAYSATMPRPLTFLEPYIGGRALNPLGLGDRAREGEGEEAPSAG